MITNRLFYFNLTTKKNKQSNQIVFRCVLFEKNSMSDSNKTFYFQFFISYTNNGLKIESIDKHFFGSL